MNNLLITLFIATTTLYSNASEIRPLLGTMNDSGSKTFSEGTTSYIYKGIKIPTPYRINLEEASDSEKLNHQNYLVYKYLELIADLELTAAKKKAIARRRKKK